MSGCKQRHTKHFPCPVCTGYDELPRGTGVRCDGWTQDGVAHCAREQLAGELRPDPNGRTWPHRLEGLCACGEQHGQALTPRSSRLPRRQPRRTKAAALPSIGEPTAIYPYYAADGCLVKQQLRYSSGADKTFRQRQPDGKGGWRWTVEGTEPIPYRLPELLAARPERPVFLCEGEKDADQLAGLGLIATTTGSATSWTPAHAPYFTGRHVILVPDHDPDGERYAQAAASDLVGIAASVRILRLPGLAPHGDVSDWLDVGHTLVEFLELAAAAPAWQLPDAPETGNHTACERTIAQLRRRCERYRQFAVQRGTEARQLREQNRAVMAVLGNKQLSAGQRLTAIGLTYHITGDQSRGAADAEQRTHISSTQIAALTGQSTASVRDHLTLFASIGTCTKKVTRTVDPITGAWRSELRAGFSDGNAGVVQRLTRFAAIDLERERKPGSGQPRPGCEDHPDAPVLVLQTRSCTTCERIIDTAEHIELPLNGNFSHSASGDTGLPSVRDPRTFSGNGSHSAATPSVVPLPTSRTCADCNGVLHWLEAGCWACRACGVLTGYAVAGES